MNRALRIWMVLLVSFLVTAPLVAPPVYAQDSGSDGSDQEEPTDDDINEDDDEASDEDDASDDDDTSSDDDDEDDDEDDEASDEDDEASDEPDDSDVNESSSSEPEEPPFKARSREEIASAIEEQAGKPPVWVGLDLDPNKRFTWNLLLSGPLSAGWNDCLQKNRPNAIDQYGRVGADPGSNVTYTANYEPDGPDPDLLNCTVGYFNTNDVPGPDGRPVRVALDPNQATALSEQAAKERQNLIDSVLAQEKATEEGGGEGDPLQGGNGGGEGSSGSGGSGSGSGGSGGDDSDNGGSGPGGSGPGGSDGDDDGPVPEGSDGPEDVEELPGGEVGPVFLTDLDTFDDPRPKDTLHWEDLGHELQVLGSNINPDLGKMTVNIDDKNGEELEGENLDSVKVSGQAGIRFTLPKDLVGGKNLEVTITNADDVAGTEGPVTSGPKTLNVIPVAVELFTEPVSGAFGERGGTGSLVAGESFFIRGQGFPKEAGQIELSVDGKEVTVDAVTNGDEDEFEAKAPSDLTVGAEIEVKFKIRSGTDQEVEVVVDPNPTFHDPDQPTEDPLLTRLEDSQGTEISELTFNNAGKVEFTIVGQNLATNGANTVLWNGKKLPESHMVVGDLQNGQNGSQKLPVVVLGAQTSAPLIEAGKVALAVEVEAGDQTLTSSTLNTELVVALEKAFPDLTEGETFQVKGFGFGDSSSDLRIAIDGANASPVGSSVQFTGGAFVIEYTCPNVGQVAAGETKRVVGRATINGVSWNFGDPSFLGVHPSLQMPDKIQVTQPAANP